MRMGRSSGLLHVFDLAQSGANSYVKSDESLCSLSLTRMDRNTLILSGFVTARGAISVGVLKLFSYGNP